MRGVDYVIRKSIELGMPVAVNISFGNSYGAHNGQSLVERYLDSVAGLGRCCICVGAGNEGVGAGHASGIVRTGEEQRTELAVQEKEAGLNVQIWKNYTDEMSITLVNPSRCTDRTIAGSAWTAAISCRTDRTVFILWHASSLQHKTGNLY